MDPRLKLITSSITELSVESTSDDHKYSRDSFDRFGDDLCELLLSYLTFKDKIVLEDVCRQWKRTIYNKQTVLSIHLPYGISQLEEIPLMDCHLNELMVPIQIKNFVTSSAYNQNMRTIDMYRLKSLLNKCTDIKKIKLTQVYIDGPLLELIAQMCPNLQSLQLDLIGLKEKHIISFGQKCGPNLRQIIFNNNQEVASYNDYSHKFCAELGRKLLSFCANIKSIKCIGITFVNETSFEFLPKLESFDLGFDVLPDHANFKQFIDIYENRLKKLKLTILGHIEEFQTFSNIMEQMSRLKNIEDLNILLSLRFQDIENLNIINDTLKKIAKNSPKITKFNLEIFFDSEVISGTIWEALGKFVNLRQLDVRFNLLEIDETAETLKNLKYLTNIWIDTTKMGDPFFKDIDLFLPQLKTLHVNSDYDFSDILIESLSKLKNLTQISLGNRNKALQLITDLEISKLLDNCPKLRRLVFNSRPNITPKTVDNLIEFANKNPKNDISFICCNHFHNNEDDNEEPQFAPIDLTTYTNIPTNLTIII